MSSLTLQHDCESSPEPHQRQNPSLPLNLRLNSSIDLEVEIIKGRHYRQNLPQNLTYTTELTVASHHPTEVPQQPPARSPFRYFPWWLAFPKPQTLQTQRLVITVVGDCHEGDNTAVRGVRRTLCRPKYAEKDFERRPVTRIERKHPFSFPRAALTRRVTVGMLIT